MNPIVFIRRIVTRNGTVVSDGPPPSAEEQERLQREYERTHPPQVDRISGCCDPVE